MAKDTKFVPEDFTRALDEEPREETQVERDDRINKELTADKYAPDIPERGDLPERIVHDSHGNVRAEVTDLGIGSVTVQDVLQAGRFKLVKRDDGFYDVYNAAGVLVVTGASAADAAEYQK